MYLDIVQRDVACTRHVSLPSTQCEQGTEAYVNTVPLEPNQNARRFLTARHWWYELDNIRDTTTTPKGDRWAQVKSHQQKPHV